MHVRLLSKFNIVDKTDHEWQAAAVVYVYTLEY